MSSKILRKSFFIKNVISLCHFGNKRIIEAKVSKEIKADETEQGADEPEYLGEDAIGFLHIFG